MAEMICWIVDLLNAVQKRDGAESGGRQSYLLYCYCTVLY